MDPRERRTKEKGEPSWNPTNQTIDLLQFNNIFSCFTDIIEALLQLARDFGDLKAHRYTLIIYMHIIVPM